MKRLLVVAAHYPEYAFLYAAGMAGFWDVVLCLDETQALSEFEEREFLLAGIRRVERLRFKTPFDLVRLCLIVVRSKASIVHLQEAVGPRRGIFNVCVALIAKRFAQIVLTVHDPQPHMGRDLVRARQTAWSRNLVRRMADIVVVHGSFCTSVYNQDKPENQIVITSDHGVILLPPENMRWEPAHFSILLFGRMEAYKGLEVLCSALEILHEDNVPIKVKIAGIGPELDRLEDRFRNLPRVEIVNEFVKPVDLIRYMQDASCVVLPYLEASQSGVVSAAFANGRFVIASRTGGLVDVVDHMRNGLLVPPGDPKALAHAIRQVSSDHHLCSKLREGAQLTADYKLSWNRIACELSSVLVESLDTNMRTPL